MSQGRKSPRIKLVVSEQLRHLLIELGKVVFDHAQFVQR
jgi:hypothetical protein